MYKPGSLRKHLTSAVAELARDPDKLSILVKRGRTVCGGEASLSFEYEYTVQLVVLDYAGEADHIMLPLLVWLRTHQRDYFDNHQNRQNNFRFEAEYNNTSTIDLVIELDLTESVIVTVQDPEDHDAPGKFLVKHPIEPPVIESLSVPGVWEFEAPDQPDRTWNTSPLDADHAPRLDQ